MKDQSHILDDLVIAWSEAAKVLGFVIHAPFTLSGDDEYTVQCVGYLPDFGSPKGMIMGYIVGPEYETDGRIVKTAERLGVFYSFINYSFYKKFDSAVFQEALRDWGYFGLGENAPRWLEDQSPL